MSSPVGMLMVNQTPATTKRYLASVRAAKLLDVYLSPVWVSNVAAAMGVVLSMMGLAYPSVRWLTAAAAQQLRDQRGHEVGEEFADLVYAALHSLGPWPKPEVARTSAMKLKTCKSQRAAEKMRKTLRRLHRDKIAEGSTSGLGTRTYSMVQVCSILGLRPIEIPNVNVLWQNGRTYIEIRNAKATNHRGCGEFRHFSFEDPCKEICRRLVRALNVLKKHWSENRHLPDPWKMMYDQCRGRLYRVTLEIYGRSAKKLTLYTFRHLLSSDLKAVGMDRSEIAAIFGHGSNATCGKHYAKAMSALGRRGMPIADPDTVSKVRRKHVAFTGPQKGVKVTTPPPPPPSFNGPTFG